MTTETKIYGVSYGDGNNGVSQMFPSFYVITDKPWTLAKLAQVSTFKPGAGKTWCLRNLDIDGEVDNTFSATLYNPPCEDTSDGEYPDVEDPEDAEDGRNWSDHSGAWSICEVFPVDEKEAKERLVNIYDSLASAFSAEDIALVGNKED